MKETSVKTRPFTCNFKQSINVFLKHKEYVDISMCVDISLSISVSAYVEVPIYLVVCQISSNVLF